MNALLHTVDLSVGHGGRVVLAGVDLSLVPGELVAMIGVNGSGKSTLLRTLAGLLSPIAGNVLLEGRPLSQCSARERARSIAVVLTGRPHVGLLDVYTLVSLGRQPWTGHMGQLTPEDHRRVDRALEEVGLRGSAGRGVSMLSDGERQKMMIARALVQETPVLLLDEPTAFLDLVNRVQVMRLLRSIAHGMGRVVMLSTHDLRTALDLADRLVVVHEGRVWSGTPDEAIGHDILARAFQGDGARFDAQSGTLR